MCIYIYKLLENCVYCTTEGHCLYTLYMGLCVQYIHRQTYTHTYTCTEQTRQHDDCDDIRLYCYWNKEKAKLESYDINRVYRLILRLLMQQSIAVFHTFIFGICLYPWQEHAQCFSSKKLF